MTQELFKCFGINKQWSTPFHPQTNGLTERLNKTLCDMISMYVNSDHKNWDQFLCSLNFAYNASCQETTGLSPFKLMFGVEPIFPLETMLSQGLVEEYPKRALDIWMLARDLAAENIVKQQLKSKERHDDHVKLRSFNIGDRVLIFTPKRMIGKSAKLMHNFYGPYEVVELCPNSPGNYIVQRCNSAKNAKLLTVNICRMKKYFD